MIKQIKIKAVIVVTLLLASLACAVAPEKLFAFEVSKTSTGAEIKWQTPSETIRVNEAGGPSGNLSAIQAAMQTWTEVPSSGFSFVYGGATAKTAADYGSNDGQNIICFGPMGANGTLAENTFWFYSSGQMVDSDIQFNTSYPYATDSSVSSYDVQSLATHELGHSLSLGDLYGASDVEKTMYGYGTKGDLSKRTLHQDDIDGITYLYPTYSAQPPSVQTGSASSVAADSARLNGSVNPNGASSSYYFEYGTTNAYGLTTSAGLAGSGTSYISVSKEISGLTLGTIYHFRLVASNASGTVYGQDSTFTTPAPPSAQTGVADLVTAFSAKLNGSVNPNGASTSYYFEYGTTVSYGLTTFSGLAGSGTSYLSVSQETSGLSPGTLYHFRLVANNASGTVYGQDSTFTTPAPPSAQTGGADLITASSARLNGSVNPNGASTSYYFEYGTTVSYGLATATGQAGSGVDHLSASADLSGLMPQTTYHFRFIAFSSAGVSYGEDRSFTTMLPPSVKTNPATAIKPSSVSGITSSSAQLNAAVNPNGSTTEYYFEYGPSPSLGSATPVSQAGSGYNELEVSALLTGLTPNITYYFRIVAASAAGASYGGTVSFLTTKPRPMPWLRLLLLDEEPAGAVPTNPNPNEVPP